MHTSPLFLGFWLKTQLAKTFWMYIPFQSSKTDGQTSEKAMHEATWQAPWFALCFSDWPKPLPDHIACIKAARQTHAPSVQCMSKNINFTGVSFYIWMAA